jgi:hypothetical protein
MLTQERLKELLHYDPDTGLFTRRINVKGRFRSRAGDLVGSLKESGYVVISVDCKYYRAHLLAFLYMTGRFPSGQCDHVNSIRKDNRWINLREVSRNGNCQNQRTAQRNNVNSGLLGVFLHKKTQRWNARITVESKEISLGYFDCKFQAHDAYLAAKRKLHATCTI